MKEFWKYFVENIKNIIKDLKSKDKEKRRKQIPNLLTLIRGIFAPITIIPSVINGKIYLAFVLVAICALTDSFDGWYARTYNAQSEFGAVLDAICDKIFIVTLAFPLVFIHIEWILVTLFLEVIISAINSYSKLKGYETASSIVGKIKTIVLDTAIALCYLDFIVKIPKIILNITSILTNIMQLWSIYGYQKSCRSQAAKKIENSVV